jgi:hypothetical protein
MAVPHGSGAYFSLDATDISTYCNTQSLDKVRDLAETSTFGSTDKTHIAGMRGHTISIAGPWDPTLDGVMNGADDGAVVAFVMGPEGNVGGDVQYSGNCLISNYNWTAPVGSEASWSASFTVTGTVTRGTV